MRAIPATFKPCFDTCAVSDDVSQRQWSLRRLFAASWVLRVIGESRELEATVRSSWVNLPIGGRTDLDELGLALASLKEIKLVEEDSGYLSASPKAVFASRAEGIDGVRLLYFVILEAAIPLWVLSVTGYGEVVHDELIPDYEKTILLELYDAREAREAFLLALARKFDSKSRARMGLEGELYVMELCERELGDAGRMDLIPRIRHVSKISDQLGYDIVAPYSSGLNRRLEVKATATFGLSTTFFISRNELECGMSDPHWFLVIVGVGDRPRLLGYLRVEQIDIHLPSDSPSTPFYAGR